MTAQGISLINLGGDQALHTKSAKASEAGFDSFMSTQADKVSAKEAPQQTVSLKGDKNDNSVSLRSTETGTRADAKMTGRYGKDSNVSNEVVSTEESVDVVEVSEMLSEAMLVLQEIFGLSEEELTDVMEQLGMQVQDLLFQVQDGNIALLNTEAIQQLVMGVHGIEDTAVFLTNDVLTQELNILTEQLTAVLADGFGVEPKDLADVQQNLLAEFSEQMEQMLSGQEDTAEGVVEDGSVAVKSGETMQVVAEQETAQSGDSFMDTQSGNMNNASTLPEAANVSPVATFTENLSKALEKTDMPQMTTEQTMTHIVEQVVKHVRIRVMPETTSMELQLNPASLGRVGLTVATTGGTATATMVVENQMAKEALESQMIVLKETFAERGIKVEEVEVTIGEFNLNKENHEQEEANGNKKSHRRFRFDEELTEADEAIEETNMTASERRDVNSVVDYTA